MYKCNEDKKCISINIFAYTKSNNRQLIFNIQYSEIWKSLSIGWEKKNIIMYDAQDPHETKQDSMGGNIHVKNEDI